MKTPKKMHFDIFASFLAFSTPSPKNLNFQRYFERIQLSTRKFYNHWFFLLSRRWYCSLSKIQKKSKFTKKKEKIKIYKKNREEKEKLRDQFGNLLTLLL
jgi:coproporphyrinogen III oxidase-like Fe-S oxidoreductase